MKKFEDEFNTLIKKEKLNDLSIYFSDYESYEEIPLFSRYKNISFLSELSFNEKNKMLIRKGIELIRHVREVSLSYLKKDEAEDYFICLSITDWDFEDYKEINCLSPYIYISRKKEWLLSCLELTQKNSIEENLVKEYLCFLDLNDCDVYVSGKCANTNRVYILDQHID